VPIATPTDQAVVDGHGMSVLIVEDNRDVGQFATDALGELGYTTVLKSSADDALAELAQRVSHYDVVFSDVVMPGMTGIEMAQQIRALYADLPVVLTSGYSHVLAENGTFGFELLQKPYSVEQLSRVLNKVGQRRRGQRSLRQT
jgi:CheY-like chemotaxis protein